MGFLIFIILIIITVIIIKAVKSSKNDDFHNHTLYHNNSTCYYNDIDEDFDDCDNYNYDNNMEDNSSFAYPDPYRLPPESSMYLDEDGELLEDL